MDFAHIYELHRLLDNRRYPVPLTEILHTLECSRSTFHRIREVMVDYLGAPIVNLRGRGYYYHLKAGERFELPGLWFNADEIAALAVLTQLSESIQPALVSELLKPLDQRFEKLLDSQNINPRHWRDRIRVASQWQRNCDADVFKRITSALLHRQRLKIHHWHWQRNETVSRTISPQRLLLYRDNWYLDAWCHLRNGFRTFAVAAINDADIIHQAALDMPAAEVDARVSEGYGIFAGTKHAEAELKFSPEISRRVAHENWHPQQRSDWTEQQELLLTIPYSDPRELLRDILHYGCDVEVLAPDALREQVKNELEKTLKKYF